MEQGPDDDDGPQDVEVSITHVVVAANLRAALRSTDEVVDLVAAVRERWGLTRDPDLRVVGDPSPDDPDGAG